MSGLDLLAQHTQEFLRLHWPNHLSNEELVWISNEDWRKGRSVPNHDSSGVYALINKDDQVVYVGSAISKSRYSIARRLLNHVIKRKLGDFRPKWKKFDVQQLATLRLPEDFRYLSAALELYLIQKISPKCNVTHKAANAPHP